jgi:hypothetical protein
MKQLNLLLLLDVFSLHLCSAAGSGGAGVTLLVATFLILSEKALTVVNGQRRPVQVRHIVV